MQLGDNPPNVPLACPIENFWANLSLKVYDLGWQAQTKLFFFIYLLSTAYNLNNSDMSRVSAACTNASTYNFSTTSEILT